MSSVEAAAGITERKQTPHLLPKSVGRCTPIANSRNATKSSIFMERRATNDIIMNTNRPRYKEEAGMYHHHNHSAVIGDDLI